MLCRQISLGSWRSVLIRGRETAALAALMLGAGCGSAVFMPPTPVGPGAATSDVRPFLADAATVAYVGCLQCINIPSPEGSYNTWSLAPAGPRIGAEVDIRQCRDDVRGLQGQTVLVQGKLIDRGRQHLPLLVAEKIIAEDPQNRVAGLLLDTGLE